MCHKLFYNVVKSYKKTKKNYILYFHAIEIHVLSSFSSCVLLASINHLLNSNSFKKLSSSEFEIVIAKYILNRGANRKKLNEHGLQSALGITVASGVGSIIGSLR